MRPTTPNIRDISCKKAYIRWRMVLLRKMNLRSNLSITIFSCKDRKNITMKNENFLQAREKRGASRVAK